MRAPIIVLIVIYAIAIFGLTLVPASTPRARPAPLSFFHAFYFISYTATTIGFGEIPSPFRRAQRLWVTICIYLTVVGWSYSVVTLIALLQDKGFQNTLTTNRFARRVRHDRQDFYLICGCGGNRQPDRATFDHIGQAFVVLEKDELRVEELDLPRLQDRHPGLAADARLPETCACRPVPRQMPRRAGGDQRRRGQPGHRHRRPPAQSGHSGHRPRRGETVAANMASFGTDHHQPLRGALPTAWRWPSPRPSVSA